MIDIEKVIYTVLSTDATLTALVSTRIYIEYAPQGTAYPYVTFQHIDAVPVRSFSGYSGVTLSRLQVDAWAITDGNRFSVTRAIRLALTDRAFLHAGVRTQALALDQYRSLSEPPFDGSDRMIRRTSMDFIVPWFEEPVTT